MGSNTSKLNLYKSDPAVDGNDTFNIKTMLNDNWDKIDAANDPTSASSKALLANPELTGTPTAPTAAQNTNTTQIATTAFVQTQISGISIPTKSSDIGAIATSQIGIVGGVAKQDDLVALDAKVNSHSADLTKHFTAVNDTGATNAYVITPSTPITEYTLYQTFKFKALNANTGASTLNVSGKGAIAIMKNVSTALVSGDILAGQIIEVAYDGTNFELIPVNQQPDGAWVKIAEQTLASAIAQVDFASIPSGYKNFRIIMSARSTSATNQINLVFNNDVGANYEFWFAKLYITMNTINYLAMNGIQIGDYALTPSTEYPSFSTIEISNYNSTKAKRVIIISGSKSRCGLTTGAWNNTVNEINRISIVATTNTMEAGSIFTLWGCK